LCWRDFHPLEWQLASLHQIATLAPLAITGSFTQTAAGALGLDFAGDSSGQYGALAISGSASLNGGLGIDLTNGFTLTKGESFDILNFASLTGGFASLALDGATCMARPKDSWACGGGVRLTEDIDATSLDLLVTHGSAAFGPASPSPIPEPSTWAMLALGFLGLGGLGLRKRKRTDESSASSSGRRTMLTVFRPRVFAKAITFMRFWR